MPKNNPGGYSSRSTRKTTPEDAIRRTGSSGNQASPPPAPYSTIKSGESNARDPWGAGPSAANKFREEMRGYDKERRNTSDPFSVPPGHRRRTKSF
jgi:hypothetical protein